jgi:hypothetical protein
MFKKLLLLYLVLATFINAMSQEFNNKQLSEQAAKNYFKLETDNYYKAVSLAKTKGWPITMENKNGSVAKLVGVDLFGLPQYVTTFNNTIAAATISTSALWPGGSAGLSLSGSSANVKGKIAVWDGGSPLPTHVELNGKITWKDANAQSVIDHATHTSGTMVATGVNPVAKGMAFGAQQLIAYDFNNHISEIMNEAPNLLVSNHSYGTIAGWYYNSGSSRWEWYGDVGATVDYKFGYYDNNSKLLDSTLVKNPNYLPLFAAGNPRDVNGPAVGQPYYRYNSSGQMAAAGNRPAGISDNSSYTTIATYANAKNVMTVGAVSGLPYGYNKASDVVMSSFSGWGPTTDGRIKPDVVADGVNVTSCVSTSNTAYASLSGTSMATPNTTGSLLLLQEYYNQLHPGSFIWSSTLKAIVIHTADEAGVADGPDYQFGWGLANIKKASDVIKSNNLGNYYILEQQLVNGTPNSFTVVASGKGQLSATLAWLDPAGSVETANVFATTPKLVNDLDLRITKGTTIYYPWILDPINPSYAATKGDNKLDNVERVDVDSIVPGQTYTITVSNKGTLQGNSSKQNYSLIVGGINGTATCTTSVGGSTTTGAKIDSVVFAGIANKNTSSAGYNDYTKYTATIQPSQTIPITVSTNTRDASSNTRIIKVYIDYNNNGVFDETTELVATSPAIASSTGKLNASITTPGTSTISIGNYMLMRVIVQETSSAASIASCGAYAVGETEDFRVKVVAPSNNVGVGSITIPGSGDCANTIQYLSAVLQNKGSVDKTNIPLTAVIKNGATTVATISETFSGNLAAGSNFNYTFQTPFTSVAGVTYTISVTATLSGDQDATDNTANGSVSIAATATAPTGTASVCGSSVILKVTNASSTSNYFWYNSSTATTPIASGTTANTSSVLSSYYVQSGYQTKVGLTGKGTMAGGYQANGGNYMNYTAGFDVVLKSAKLYTRYPGKVTFIAADISNINTTTGSYSYSPLASVTIDVPSTNPNPASGAQTGNDAADNGAVFNINLPLPSGSHAIIITTDGNATIFRNNGVTGSPYPFGTSGIFQITGNSASSTTDPNYYQGFYYYLYDMNIVTNDCLSDKVAITATTSTAPVVTQTGSNLTSTIPSGTTIQWYNSGNAIAGATSATYTPTTSGSYSTIATNATTGCQLASNAVTYTVTAVVNANDTEIGLLTTPNPANTQLNVSFTVNTKADVVIQLINPMGQSAISNTYSNFSGKFKQQYNVSNLAAGVYVLKVQHGNKVYRKTILISSR